MQDQNTQPSSNESKLSLKNGIVYIALLTMTTNAVIELFNKWQEYYDANYVQSYVPRWATETKIENAIDFESIVTESTTDVIQRKWGYDSIPDVILYNKDGVVDTIDVSDYMDHVKNTDIGLLNTRWNSEISHATWLIRYLKKDFESQQCLFEEISLKRVTITPEDSYRDKVAKIQKFVRSLWYERDLVYLGKDKNLPALSNYQLPSLANLMIGKMDCNNKTGLFIQLCRSNNIIVWIGSSLTHMTPVVYSHTHDAMRNMIKANTSIWDTYNGIVVDPTISDFTNWIRRPWIAGDINGEAYNEMKFVVAE